MRNFHKSSKHQEICYILISNLLCCYENPLSMALWTLHIHAIMLIFERRLFSAMREFSVSRPRVFTKEYSHIIRVMLFWTYFALSHQKRIYFYMRWQLHWGTFLGCLLKQSPSFQAVFIFSFFSSSLVKSKSLLHYPCDVERTGRMITGAWVASAFLKKDLFHFMGRGTPCCAPSNS